MIRGNVTEEEKRMSKDLIVKKNTQALERILIHGDLSPMNEEQRLQYVKAVCKAVGVSILFRPFDYIKLNGKVVLYANRACTEQLRIIHNISLKITVRERIDGLYCVTAQAISGKGKTDESIGAVNIKGLSGEALANAMMKAETKAKRRVTLSIAGLGILDEIEAKQLAEQEQKIATEVGIEETTEKLAQTVGRPEFEQETIAPDSSMNPEQTPAPPPIQQYYVLKAGKLKGKPIDKVPKATLVKWLTWFDGKQKAGEPMHPDVQDDAFHIRPFLEESEAK